MQIKMDVQRLKHQTVRFMLHGGQPAGQVAVMEIYTRPYFVEADMSKFIASLIDFMNHDASLSNVMATTEKIHGIVDAYNNRKDMNEFHF